MCDIVNERIRINQILTSAIDDGFGAWAMQADELVQRCFLALQTCYHGRCVDECLQARASEFVAAYLSRREAEAVGFSPSARPRTGR